MRVAIVLMILGYQKLAPARIRSRCIFKHSCSNYVMDGAKHVGSAEAFRRLQKRWRCCRPGYSLVSLLDGQTSIERVVLVTNEIVETDVIRDTVLDNIRLG